MKTNWQTKKLGEVCDIKTGKKDVNEGNPNGKYPFFTCAREHTYSDSYSFDIEALLVAGNGDVGHVNYYNGKFEAYQRTYILYNFKDFILTRFLHLFLDGYLKATVSKQKLGNTMPYIKMGMLTDFEIPIPPLFEQKRIIKILDEAFGKIEKATENAEKNLNNSKEIYESYLYNIFTNPKKDWEEKKLKEICDKLFAGGDVPKKNLSKTKTEKYNIPIYANGFKDKGLYGYTDIKKVTKPSITISARGTIGYAEVREEAFFPVVRLIVLTPNTTIDLYFLYYLTHSFKFSNTGTSIPQLTIPMVENIKIPVPSLSEQKDIVKKINQLLEQTKKLEEVYKKKMADWEELKKSVLNKAFTGEL